MFSTYWFNEISMSSSKRSLSFHWLVHVNVVSATKDTKNVLCKVRKLRLYWNQVMWIELPVGRFSRSSPIHRLKPLKSSHSMSSQVLTLKLACGPKYFRSIASQFIPSSVNKEGNSSPRCVRFLLTLSNWKFGTKIHDSAAADISPPKYSKFPEYYEKAPILKTPFSTETHIQLKKNIGTKLARQKARRT